MRRHTRCGWCRAGLTAVGNPGRWLDEAHRQQVREHLGVHREQEQRAMVLKLLRGSLWWKDDA